MCGFAGLDVLNRSAQLKERIIEKPGSSLKDVLTMARTGETAREQAKADSVKVKEEPVNAISTRKVHSRGRPRESGSRREPIGQPNAQTMMRECKFPALN